MAKLQLVEKTLSEIGGNEESLMQDRAKIKEARQKHKWRSGTDESGEGTEPSATKEQQNKNQEVVEASDSRLRHKTDGAERTIQK
eukprot:14766148-Heterocapsa_arctica.AAC.1